MENHIYIVLVIVIVGISLLSSLFKGLTSGKSSENLPYHLKYILTSVEYKFYIALKALTDAQGYIVCPKVGLKDLFEVKAGTKDRQRYFRKISQKHIDFLVCDAELRPLFAIELDDKSHRRAEVKERDAFKDKLFKSAGFPLYRIPTAKVYSEEYIRGYIGISDREGIKE